MTSPLDEQTLAQLIRDDQAHLIHPQYYAPDHQDPIVFDHVIGGWRVLPAVVALAVITFAGWFVTSGNFEQALISAVVLITTGTIPAASRASRPPCTTSTARATR